MELIDTQISEEHVQDSRSPLILAVEDNEDNLLLMQYALESLNCKFICQKDSYGTFLIAKERQPNLILLDVLLPGQSGLDVVKLLKDEPLTRNIPVIAVTALAGAEEREEILLAGFDDYICKPFMIEEFESKIYEYLYKKSHSPASR
ncbi:response regulator receiver domain protein [Calothrix sp. NIES-4101]|nr:response regulator receiver domain protein [Calothrix sp. NIES-4101]